ncbi:MAG: hypothetical protein KIT09_27200 [Bryobacteraceae bacterium]|nr:hypothetical protein [Bryobacteraceae bacterium]
MSIFRYSTISALLAILSLGAAAQTGTLQVDAKANIFASGRPDVDSSGGGVLPAMASLGAGSRSVSFQSVSGRVSCDGVDTAGPDGSETCAGGATDIESLDGIAGILDEDRSMFLVGVFLTSAAPADPAPERLNFTGNHDFATLSPKVAQVFFIGDGKAANGVAQQFTVPAGATRLFLGIADAFGFIGPPGAYDDNTGVMTVNYQVEGDAGVVDARANIFAAGRSSVDESGGGVLPVVIRFSAAGGQMVRFPSVTGSISCDGVTSNGPDGADTCAGGSTDINSLNGIAGIIDSSRSMFLAGVFLDDRVPADPAPARLDFSSNHSFETLSPDIGQVFFIGDGKTGEGSGAVQQFGIPATATRLFLGIADAPLFHGDPGAYDDNTGSLSVTHQIGSGNGQRPSIASKGVRHGATFEETIAPQGWISIFGANLSSTTRSWAGSDFSGSNLPSQLDGVSVMVNGKSAYVSYVSPGQINALAPTDRTEGNITVQVRTNQGTSETAIVAMRHCSPGFFMLSPEGGKYVAAVHLDGAYVGKAGLFGPALVTRPAAPGNMIQLYGTGGGETSPEIPDGKLIVQPLPLAERATVRFGSADVTVQFAGLVMAGLYQFNVVVPDLPSGDYELTVEIEGVRSPGGKFITVAR